jgi:hypothetical protein
MKELTRKILESGLVEKHAVLLMEKWGQLDPGAADLVGRKQVTVESLSKFVEEIDQLVSLDAAGDTKETRLEVYTSSKVSLRKQGVVGCFEAAIDDMGHLLVDPSVNLIPGDILVREADGVMHQVLEVTRIYQNDQLVTQQVSVG